MCFLHTGKERPALTGEAYEKLLSWLSPDAQVRGKSYQNIYNGLSKFFEARKCLHPRECADETLDRVAKNIMDGKVIMEGNAGGYCRAVAKYVWLEYQRCPLNKITSIEFLPQNLQPISPLEKTQQELEDEEHEEQEKLEQKQRERALCEKCTEQCLKMLKPEERKLFNGYNRKKGKIKRKIVRKIMAAKRGISMNALRQRASEINKKLEECVENCIRAVNQN